MVQAQRARWWQIVFLLGIGVKALADYFLHGTSMP